MVEKNLWLDLLRDEITGESEMCVAPFACIHWSLEFYPERSSHFATNLERIPRDRGLV